MNSYKSSQSSLNTNLGLLPEGRKEWPILSMASVISGRWASDFISSSVGTTPSESHERYWKESLSEECIGLISYSYSLCLLVG